MGERADLKCVHLQTSSQKLISKLWGVTCHMGSHTVTCHPTQVNESHLNTDQVGWYSIFQRQRDERSIWPWWLVICRDNLPVHRTIHRITRSYHFIANWPNCESNPCHQTTVITQLQSFTFICYLYLPLLVLEMDW